MVNAGPPSAHSQLPSSHGFNNRIACPPSVLPYGFAPVGFHVLSCTAVPLYVTGLLPPKTTHDPLPVVMPAAQNVFECTLIAVATLLARLYVAPHAGRVCPLGKVTFIGLFSVSAL